jgi:hypothetical protein
VEIGIIFVPARITIWTLLHLTIITMVQFAMVVARVYSLRLHLQWVDNLLFFICVFLAQSLALGVAWPTE